MARVVVLRERCELETRPPRSGDEERRAQHVGDTGVRLDAADHDRVALPAENFAEARLSGPSAIAITSSGVTASRTRSARNEARLLGPAAPTCPGSS